MKTIKFALVMAAASFMISCGGDESQPANKIVIDGNSIGIVGAYYHFYDKGCDQIRSNGCTSDTHRRYGFLVTDGDYPEEDEWPSNDTFTYFMDLRSPDTENFYLGTYDLVKGQVSVSDDEPFGWSLLVTDNNDIYTWDIEGEVTVSGSFPDNLKFEFDVTVGYYSNPGRQDGGPDATMEVTGYYKGEFLERYID